MQKGGMILLSKSIRKKLLINVFTLLRTNEELLRLLYHRPNSDPLSDSHPNITGLPELEMWKIIDRHILTTSKSSDLEENRICRIYVYLGKTRPSFNNKFTTRQEVVIDVFCHLDYEKEARMEMISDKLDEIMFRSRINGGLGRVDYRNGYDFNAPRDYEAFRHIYEVGSRK